MTEAEITKALDDGLQIAFPDELSLSRLIFRIGEQFNEIASGSVPKMRLDIIQASVSKGFREKLIREAIKQRPHEPRLREAARWILPSPERYVPELWPLLSGLTARNSLVAEGVYRACLPRRFDPLRPEPGKTASPFDYANHLGTLGPDEDEAYPVFRYAFQFADKLRLDPDTAGAAAELKNWVEQSMNDAIQDPDRRYKSCRALARPVSQSAGKKEDPYLLIEARPQSPHAPSGELTRYVLRGWLLGTSADQQFSPRASHASAARPGEKPRANETGDASFSADEVPAEIVRWVEELWCAPVEPDKVRVELMLPRALLCRPLDQLRLNPPTLQEGPIGYFHSMVVRPFRGWMKRQPAPDQYGRALETSNSTHCVVVKKLPPENMAAPQLAAYAVDCAGLKPRQLWAALTSSENAAVVCCILNTPPKPNDQKDMLDALIQVKVPVIVWVREHPGAEVQGQCPPENGAVEGIHDPIELIHNKDLHALPRRVRDVRREADDLNANIWHIGKHLTLIWDDPRRPLPDETAPQLGLEQVTENIGK